LFVALSSFMSSEVGSRAAALLAVLLVLLLSTSGLNVINTYVARDFITSIEHRDRAGFLREAVLYVGVFALLTIAAVLYRFVEERLGLLWRRWLARRLVAMYLGDHAYQRLNREGFANPDGRIADDVRTFVTMTISLLLMLVNGTITVIAFSGVLWSISRTLFIVGIVYAAAGSALTVLLGQSLIRLNYVQADREADFRSELIHVREHADSVALLRREHQFQARLFERIDALVGNLKRIIAVNRNLGFFTTGYNYLVQVIPALIVAPLFIQGAAEFGVITQSALAFTHLLGAFSLVVTQFQAISSNAAVLARLSALTEGTLRAKAAASRGIEFVHADDRLAWEHLTLHGSQGALLVDDLDVEVARGSRLLIRGDGAASAALFRATAGLWEFGEGRIVLPQADGIVFLPERPYLPPGTLRETLGAGAHSPASDARIVEALRALDAEAILLRAGGLDSVRNWPVVLSLREQQLVSLAAVLLSPPRFVLMERIALDLDRTGSVLRLLSGRGIACVTIADDGAGLDCHDAVLSLVGNGQWTFSPVHEGVQVQ
jgi:putative ATP-binding cassette transporter